MSSGWPIGAGKCGNLIASKCGQWGIGSSVPTMAATLYGAFLFQGSLNSLVLSVISGSLLAARADSPWGTPQSGYPRMLSSVEEGVYHVVNYQRYRYFAGFTISAGQAIKAANLKLVVTANGATQAFNLVVYANPTCSNPPVAANWSNGGTGTLIATIPYATGTFYVPVSPIFLTAGATNYFSICSDQDLANTSPGANSASCIATPTLILSW